MKRFLFPRWTNTIRPALGAALALVPLYLIVLIGYGAAPRTTDVGYMPRQPVEYSHALHAGELGIDCRYCHHTVERAAFAAIPATETCMNCHARIRTKSEKLIPVRDSYNTGMPIDWVKIHDLPDYAYFDHSIHVHKGVGCVSCHGRLDLMEEVYQAETLSMGWCLDCHRNPEPHLRPVEEITTMEYLPAGDQQTVGAELARQYDVNPREDCTICHR